MTTSRPGRKRRRRSRPISNQAHRGFTGCQAERDGVAPGQGAGDQWERRGATVGHGFGAQGAGVGAGSARGPVAGTRTTPEAQMAGEGPRLTAAGREGEPGFAPKAPQEKDPRDFSRAGWGTCELPRHAGIKFSTGDRFDIRRRKGPAFVFD